MKARHAIVHGTRPARRGGRQSGATAGASFALRRASAGARPPTCTSPPSSSANGPRSGCAELQRRWPHCPRGRRFRFTFARSASSPIRIRRASSGAASRRPGCPSWPPIPTALRRRWASRPRSAPYSPHLTLARIKEKLDLQPLRAGHRRPALARVRALHRAAASFCIAASCAPPVPCTLNLRSFPSQSDESSLSRGLIAYLLGAIPFGYLLVKWKTGADVRASGSGNIGATNVLRTTGRAAGVLRCCSISPRDTWRSGSPAGLRTTARCG